MPACLLHVRSKIVLRHIEAELDEFEQRFIPDDHYVVSREDRTANYVVVPDRNLSTFSTFLQKGTENLLLERLSLIEIGRSYQVREQGCSEPYAEDACGEWRRVRNEESFAIEEIRVRTGLQPWLRKHARGGLDHPEKPIALFLYFHQKLDPESRWLSNLRDALGKSSRAHLHDDHSILLTAETSNETPEQIFASKRYRQYIEAGFVHTAFCFTLGPQELHPAGTLQSVLPPKREAQSNVNLEPQPSPFMPHIIEASQSRDLERIRASIAKLKSQPRRSPQR